MFAILSIGKITNNQQITDMPCLRRPPVATPKRKTRTIPSVRGCRARDGMHPPSEEAKVWMPDPEAGSGPSCVPARPVPVSPIFAMITGLRRARSRAADGTEQRGGGQGEVKAPF